MPTQIIFNKPKMVNAPGGLSQVLFEERFLFGLLKSLILSSRGETSGVKPTSVCCPGFESGMRSESRLSDYSGALPDLEQTRGKTGRKNELAVFVSLKLYIYGGTKVPFWH